MVSKVPKKSQLGGASVSSSYIWLLAVANPMLQRKMKDATTQKSNYYITVEKSPSK